MNEMQSYEPSTNKQQIPASSGRAAGKPIVSAVNLQQEHDLAVIDLALDILAQARNELYLNMRYLDVSLSSLRPVPDGSCMPFGCDGEFLFFSAEGLCQLYKATGRTYLAHAYLHMIMHCLFCHPFPKKEVDENLWNLAADITTEYILDGLYQKCIHLPASSLRRSYFARLRAEKKTVTVQRIYRQLLMEKPDEIMLMRLAREFQFDDHSKWLYAPDNPKNSQMRKKWEEASDRMETEMEIFGKEPSGGDGMTLTEQVEFQNRKKYDFHEFLRKFSVLREEMSVDPDSFDYIFYSYGLEHYHNMPLIEPLETRETRKIEEFVIVIDTSMSCKGDLILRFLEETYDVLSESDSFFRKVKVHIIQCDEKVQEDVVIRNNEEMKQYLQRFTVKGFGGTDFRPAFAYVNDLVSMGHFTKLKGLIYFTDGYGVFPVRRPIYDTAFIFMKDDYRDVDVPLWACKLILDPEELENRIEAIEYHDYL